MIKIENLKKNWCPVCNQELNWNEERELLECSQCDYAITKEQFTDYKLDTNSFLSSLF